MSTSTTSCGNSYVKCPFYIEFFVTIAAFWMYHMFNVLSKNYAVAFNVPYRHAGAYVTKLYSFRCLATFLGALLKDFLERNIDTDLQVISFTTLVLLLITRFVYSVVLHTSLHPAVDIYKILVVEAFFFGYFQMTLFTLLTTYYCYKPMAVHGSSIFVTFMQTMIGLPFGERSMFVLKFNAWFCFVITLLATGFWFYYLFYEYNDKILAEVKKAEDELNKPPDNKFKCRNFTKFDYRNKFLFRPKMRYGFKGHVKRILCPFSMLLLTTVFKDILYPAVLPYSMLERDRCNMVNVLMPLLYFPGAYAVFALNEYLKTHFVAFKWYFHYIYLLIIPQIVVFVLCFLVIHTDIPKYKVILNSRLRIMFMAFVLQFCYSVLEYTSSLTVAHYVYKRSKNIKDSLVVLTYHNIFTWFARYFCSRLGFGYNAARLDYEYSISVYHPTYMMTNFEAVWFWCKDTVKRAYNDAIHDFDMNVRRYL